MSVRRHYLGLALLLMIATGAVLAASAILFAQERSHMEHAQHMHGADAVTPTHPGQEAFGTIQEIVRILEADPITDWSKVNIGALREHLIDMDEVTLRARASERPSTTALKSLLRARAARSVQSSAWFRRIPASWLRSGGAPALRICRMESSSSSPLAIRARPRSSS